MSSRNPTPASLPPSESPPPTRSAEPTVDPAHLAEPTAIPVSGPGHLPDAPPGAMAQGDLAPGTLQPEITPGNDLTDRIDVGGGAAPRAGGLDLPDVGGDIADLDDMTDLHIDPGYDLENLAGQGSVDGRTHDAYDGVGGGGESRNSLEGAAGDGYGPMQTVHAVDSILNFGSGIGGIAGAAGTGVSGSAAVGSLGLGTVGGAAFGAFASGWSMGREIGESETAYDVVAGTVTAVTNANDQGAFGEGQTAPATPAEQTNTPDDDSALLGGNDHGTSQPADSTPAPAADTDGQSVEGEDASTETSVGQPATSGGVTEDQVEGGYSGPRSPGSAPTDAINQSLLQGLGGDRGGDVDPGREPGESYDAGAVVYDLEDAVVDPGDDFVAGGTRIDSSILDDPIDTASPYFGENEV